MTKDIKKLIDKSIRDKNGNAVLGQSPNLPILGWLVCITVSFLLPSGLLKTGFGTLGSALLFLWAYLEITDGSTIARRALGIIVMAIVVYGYFFMQ